MSRKRYSSPSTGTPTREINPSSELSGFTAGNPEKSQLIQALDSSDGKTSCLHRATLFNLFRVVLSPGDEVERILQLNFTGLPVLSGVRTRPTMHTIRRKDVEVIGSAVVQGKYFHIIQEEHLNVKYNLV